MNFADGLKSLFNNLINRRNSQSNNIVTSMKITDDEANNIYKTGLGSKIVRIKTSHALKRSMQFANKDDEKFYNKKLKKKVKEATKWMLVFGRGIIVIQELGADLTKPLRNLKDINPNKVVLHVFSGDMVTVPTITRTLGRNYFKPESYKVRGFSFHPSRVIDFTYVKPIEEEAPQYRYGGISEFELIRPQIINDGIVERASAHIVEKNSTLFYKYKGFKAALESGNEKTLLEFFRTVEDARSIYGAGIIDVEDSVETVDQSLTNLSEVDMITLRRLAMVTGIPLALLVGENVKGLNSTGDNEKEAFQDMVENVQEEFLIDPINELLNKFGKGDAEFKENQGGSANDKADYESKIIKAAVDLELLGQDSEQYLKDKGVIKEDPIEDFFKLDENLEDEIEENAEEANA